MTVLAKIQRDIRAYKGGHNGKPPAEIVLSGWRDRYRLLIEMRRLRYAHARPWREEHDPVDQELARELRETQKHAEIRIYGIPVVCSR